MPFQPEKIRGSSRRIQQADIELSGWRQSAGCLPQKRNKLHGDGQAGGSLDYVQTSD